MGSLVVDKPRLVCIPFPAQDISPMINLAKLFHFRGFYITFVNTELTHERLLSSRGPESIKDLDDFQFKTITDGSPPSDPHGTKDPPDPSVSFSKNLSAPFCSLIAKLNDPASNVPRVTCIIADGVMTFALGVGKDLCLPIVLFWTASASGLMGYLQYPQLLERGIVPLKDESSLTNGYLDTHINWIPGMTNIRLRDLPSFIRTTDPNDTIFKFLMDETQRAFQASAIILNTFDDLEREVLDAIKAVQLPRIYTIGPLPKLCRQIADPKLNFIGSNLWKEDTGCLEWLDRREPKSVFYVNYGSHTIMTNHHLREFAWGLANSKHPFLWVIRPDLVKGDSAILPEEFVMEIEGRGLLSSWCPQEQVLSHRSIGGFLTHSGWNSTVESICEGLPLLSWPFFGEQPTNCRYACNEWGIGMEIDNDVKRDEVEGLVRELMEGGKGKEMKNAAMELKERAEEAINEGGSSYVNMEKLIKEVLNLGE